MEKVIGIDTTKYSSVFRAILTEYRADISVFIDGRVYDESENEDLLSTWCTNRKIMGTRDFRLSQGGRELFSFHDSPEGLVAAYSELAFVERLKNQNIVRYCFLEVR